MSKYDQQGLDDLTAALAASFRAGAQAQREAGETGLNPELVAAYAAGTLDDRAKAAVDWLARGNPLAMVQLADAIAALPEPVPVPSVAEAWLTRAGKAAADIKAKVKAYVQAYGEAALDRVTEGWQQQVGQVVLQAEPAAFAGTTGGDEPVFPEVDGLRVYLEYRSEQVTLSILGDTTEHADEVISLVIEGPRGGWPIEVYLEDQGDLGVAGYHALGGVQALQEALGTDRPSLTLLYQ